MIQIFLREIRLPRARVFRREPYVVSTIIAGDSGPVVPLQTTPVRGTTAGRPAIFDPPVILFESTDPLGHVSGELLVMESDEDFRVLGARVEALRRTVAAGTKLAALLRGGAAVAAPEVAGLRVAVRAAVDQVEAALRNSDDDQLGRFDVHLDEANGYRSGDVITLANTRCEVDIEVFGGVPIEIRPDGERIYGSPEPEG